ncbi:MAG TPA: DUF6542 domain-containing protein [Streptosporangiaceae bacterium]|nr:DUF6542 domain-containing protein [Streptosporangiaceae bacterium]
MPTNRMPKSWSGPISAAAPAEAVPSRRASGAAPGSAFGGAFGSAPEGAAGGAGGDARGARAPGVAGDVARNPPARLTARGGMLAVFTISFAGTFTATVSHVGVLAGLSYAAACVFAACAVRRSQLLPLVVTPPMLLAVAVAFVQGITASGGVLSVASGTLVTLGNVAPWLFAGTAAGTIIALARGVAGNVRALRESLRGDTRG